MQLSAGLSSAAASVLLSVLVQSSLASITSERLTASSASPSSSPFELCQAKQDHFWSPHFRSCLSCTPCLSTLVPCGPTNDAECDDSNSASAISRIRDRNRNEAGTKTELMDGLRKRRRNRRRKNKPSNFMAIKEAMEREEVGSSEEDEEVDGKVQYMATAPGDNSLHADLQEIERELYMDRMGIPRDGDNGNGFASASTLPFSAASVSSTEPALVLGKKRFYAASSKAKKLSNGEEGNDSDDDDDNDDDTPRDVYGAVIQNPLLHSTTAPHDEIGILHSLLLDGSAEETSTSGSSSSSTGSGFRLEHGLIVIAFCSVALVLAVAALGYVKWKKVQRFKMLDNNTPCNNLLSSSHNSSFHRSTESRLTSQTSVPNSPASNKQQHDPRVLNDLGCNAVVASSSGSAGSGIDRNQRFVSIVDERGRTQLKAGRELPV